jgi:hypothetical protein
VPFISWRWMSQVTKFGTGKEIYIINKWTSKVHDKNDSMKIVSNIDIFHVV